MNARDRQLATGPLAAIVRKYDQLHAWVGTRETGVMPNTGDALLERGWVDRARSAGRLVYRPTHAGRMALEEAQPGAAITTTTTRGD